MQLSANLRFLVFCDSCGRYISTHLPNPAIFSLLVAFFRYISAIFTNFCDFARNFNRFHLQFFPQYFNDSPQVPGGGGAEKLFLQ